MNPPDELSGASNALADAVVTFAHARPRLFGIAYRMLGSWTEAEDIVQEVWLRWQVYDRGGVLNPAAFLATTTTRLAINASQSARSRHETYVGPWLPEPVDTHADPALGAERGEALEFAILVLLEKLSPTERAAYVLREAFDYPYSQIAEIVGLQVANVRQLVSRARKHVAAERREPVSSSEQQRLLVAFLSASRAGDFVALEALFAADVVSLTDSGGAVRQVARNPVTGAARVSKFVSGFTTRFWSGTTLEWVEANGQASALITRNGTPTALVAISATTEGIYQLMWVMNPAKLARMSQFVASSEPDPS